MGKDNGNRASGAGPGFAIDRRGALRLLAAAAAIAANPSIRGAEAIASVAAASSAGGGEARPLGKTGMTVATIGVGAMITREADVIRYAVDRGANYVDTADCYMGGENERIVGRALKGVRSKVILASKVHIAPVDRMIQSVEKSLKSLNTDVIDIMQLHGISTEGEVTDGNARDALRKLIDQGKVRVPGVTTHSGQEEVLKAVMKHGFYKTVLVAYNFRTDAGVKATLRKLLSGGTGISAAIRDAGAAGVGVIAMKTQAGGYPVEGGALSPHQAALAWVIENPGVATTIPSMVSFAQVDENLSACGKRLGKDGREALERYSMAIGDRHCGLCGQCKGHCPYGVDVQDVLRSLTYYEGYGQTDLANLSYRELADGRNALPCLACGSCAVQCRLGLSVGQLARRTHGLLSQTA